MELWAALKAVSLGYIIGALGLSLAAAAWSIWRPRLAARQRATVSLTVLLAACTLNVIIALLIWAGVVSGHIRMSTAYFHSLMFGWPALAITAAGLIVLAASLANVWLVWLRGRAHRRYPRQPLNIDGCRVPLMLSEASATMALVGVWRPEIWVNPAWWNAMSGAKRRLALLHELEHLRRADNLRKSAVALCAGLYSALPWIRGWNRRYELDTELAVDDNCRCQLPEREYLALVADSARFALSGDRRLASSALSEADLARRLRLLAQPRRGGSPVRLALAVVSCLMLGIAPGVTMLQFSTLRCLLACFLGY